MRTVDFNLSRRCREVDSSARHRRENETNEQQRAALAKICAQEAEPNVKKRPSVNQEIREPETFSGTVLPGSLDESRTPGENIHVVLSSNFGPSPTGAPDTTYSSAPFAFGFDVVRVNPCSHSDRSSSGLARARTKHGVSDEGRRSAEKTDFNTKVSEWCARSHQAHGHPSRPWERPFR